VRGLTWWDGRVSLFTLDVVVAAFIVLFNLAGKDPVADRIPGHAALAVVAGVALLLRRRFPFAVVLVTAAGAMVTSALTVMVASYSIAARRGVSLLTVIAAAVAGAAEITVEIVRGYTSLAVAAGTVGLFVVVPGLAGLWMFQRAALLAVLRERADEAERTRTLLADQAVSAERRRIAREMHDSVGHWVTAIALQAGALSVNAPDERTGQFAETIRSSSAAALDELRGILRVLRDDAREGDEPPWRAGKGLHASLEELVKDVVATGARIDLDLTDPLPETSDQVERAVYRVVQESLTNAGKHAPRAAVRVAVTTTDADLLVEVTNPLTATASTVRGSGYGLIGMRERVELAGGDLRTERSGGGFRVAARFGLNHTAAGSTR